MKVYRDRKIRTSFIHPPIPDRSFDWAAWDDNKGEDMSKVGMGPTERAAVDDLMEKLEEDES